MDLVKFGQEAEELNIISFQHCQSDVYPKFYSLFSILEFTDQTKNWGSIGFYRASFINNYTTRGIS
jgi:hypothetical protein